MAKAAKSSIPDFEQDGFLPPGNHKCTGKDFIQRFCKGKNREHFGKAVQDILDFSISRGAVAVLVGGSFVSKAPRPRDLDCVLIFQDENQIPDRTERLAIEGTKLDVFFCALTQNLILSSFLKLFSENRATRAVGTILIKLQDNA